MQNIPTNLLTNRPRLLADIGGTNARFALEIDAGKVSAIWVTECGSFQTIDAAISHYLTLPSTIFYGGNLVKYAAIAIATPVGGDVVEMTNHHWSFSIRKTQKYFGWENLIVTNDFKALAYSLPYLSDAQKYKVGGGAEKISAPIGLIGAGTGLGVSGLIQNEKKWIALDSEGGHTNFGPIDDREIDIFNFARQKYNHVSNERFLSGSGLVLIQQALSHIRKSASPNFNAPQIMEHGLQSSCAICIETLEVFCGILGTVAGNLAITLGAQGGVYIGGGIVPRLGNYFLDSPFRNRFEQKGRFSAYLAGIPTYVITEEYPAFIGLSSILPLRN